jgi:hypothetical protein
LVLLRRPVVRLVVIPSCQAFIVHRSRASAT